MRKMRDVQQDFEDVRDVRVPIRCMGVPEFDRLSILVLHMMRLRIGILGARPPSRGLRDGAGKHGGRHCGER